MARHAGSRTGPGRSLVNPNEIVVSRQVGVRGTEFACLITPGRLTIRRDFSLYVWDGWCVR